MNKIISTLDKQSDLIETEAIKSLLQGKLAEALSIIKAKGDQRISPKIRRPIIRSLLDIIAMETIYKKIIELNGVKNIGLKDLLNTEFISFLKEQYNLSLKNNGNEDLLLVFFKNLDKQSIGDIKINDNFLELLEELCVLSNDIFPLIFKKSNSVMDYPRAHEKMHFIDNSTLINHFHISLSLIIKFVES